jgi:DNA mismatch endonuclease (patch repair protein)
MTVMDTLTPEERSRQMSLVRSKNTRPEIAVRRVAHALGYRFRLHRRDLPGSPDLVFPRLRRVIFVHGCFWHRHSCPAGTRTPKSRTDFWTSKLLGNARRDATAIRRLRKQGWAVMIVWECQTTNPGRLARRLATFLSRPAATTRPT